MALPAGIDAIEPGPALAPTPPEAGPTRAPSPEAGRRDALSATEVEIAATPIQGRAPGLRHDRSGATGRHETLAAAIPASRALQSAALTAVAIPPSRASRTGPIAALVSPRPRPATSRAATTDARAARRVVARTLSRSDTKSHPAKSRARRHPSSSDPAIRALAPDLQVGKRRPLRRAKAAAR